MKVKSLSNRLVALALSVLVLATVACGNLLPAVQPTNTPAPTQTTPAATAEIVEVTVVVTTTPEPASTNTPTAPVQPTQVPSTNTPTAPVQPTTPAAPAQTGTLQPGAISVDQYVSPTCDGHEELDGKKVRVMSVYISIRNGDGDLIPGLSVVVDGEQATEQSDHRYRRIFHREGSGAWAFSVYANGTKLGDIYVKDPCAQAPEATPSP
ncbi:MAG TPA: hypothetical protein VMW29_02235 [Candidatus Bathyarchaeia archaeon]|nr:hypothetical protein [Candidatus Bathyarchaeia archaeon]